MDFLAREQKKLEEKIAAMLPQEKKTKKENILIAQKIIKQVRRVRIWG